MCSGGIEIEIGLKIMLIYFYQWIHYWMLL